jgi:hypothetical protein
MPQRCSDHWYVFAIFGARLAKVGPLDAQLGHEVKMIETLQPSGLRLSTGKGIGRQRRNWLGLDSKMTMLTLRRVMTNHASLQRLPSPGRRTAIGATRTCPLGFSLRLSVTTMPIETAASARQEAADTDVSTLLRADILARRLHPRFAHALLWNFEAPTYRRAASNKLRSLAAMGLSYPLAAFAERDRPENIGR